MVSKLVPVVKANNILAEDNSISIRLSEYCFLWKNPDTNYSLLVNTLKDKDSYVILDSYLLIFLKNYEG
jgi:hypothetical protein